MQRITRNPPSDSFSTTIASYRAQVDVALQKELSQRRESPFFVPFTDAFTGGKRLRPVLLLIAYDSVRGQDDDPLPAAVSYTHLRAHETPEHLVCRLLLEK